MGESESGVHFVLKIVWRRIPLVTPYITVCQVGVTSIKRFSTPSGACAVSSLNEEVGHDT